MNISIPQAAMKNSARGYISPKYWDEGINALLLNYTFTGANSRDRSEDGVNDNTCTLSPDSENIDVDMGTVSNRQFYQAGDGSAWQPFAIDLQNCGSTVSGVTVSFSGTANGRNADLLALVEGADDAAGVGIGIYDKDKNLIPLGQESEVMALSSGQASAHLQFYARYIADGSAVTAGTANASATFILAYE